MAKRKVNWQPLLLLSIAAVIAVVISGSFRLDDFRKVKTHGALADSKGVVVPFQLTGTPELGGAVFDENNTVFGVSIGGMVCQKELYGLSLAGIHAFNRKKVGVSMSLMDIVHENHGLSINVGGGAVDHYGCAIGLWNIAENNHGVQFGVINQAEPGMLIDSPQSAIWGAAEEKGDEKDPFGVQIGLFNSSEGKGLQFGLWNTNPNAWLKHFPFFNFAF